MRLCVQFGVVGVVKRDELEAILKWIAPKAVEKEEEDDESRAAKRTSKRTNGSWQHDMQKERGEGA